MPRKVWTVLELEWSEGPFHSGTYEVKLTYKTSARLWQLYSRDIPNSESLPSRKGAKDESPRDVAVELLGLAYESRSLPFDCIVDSGDFDISLDEISEPKVRRVKGANPIDPPEKVCHYCLHLQRPTNHIAAMCGAYDCGLGHWPAPERDAKGVLLKPLSKFKMQFSCPQFEPDKEWIEETYR